MIMHIGGTSFVQIQIRRFRIRTAAYRAIELRSFFMWKTSPTGCEPSGNIFILAFRREFLFAYSLISEPPEFPQTPVDRYPCYELLQLASRVIPGHVLEIGVWRGGAGRLMAKRVQAVTPKKIRLRK
jgi:hypothetical protein